MSYLRSVIFDSKYLPIVVLTLLLFPVFLFLWRRIHSSILFQSETSGVTPISVPPQKPNLARWVLAGLTLVVVCRVILQSGNPYGDDENMIASTITFSKFSQMIDINPLSEKLSGSHINQNISLVGAYVAYKLFGRNLTLLKVPVWILTAIFLLLLYRATLSGWTTFTGCLLLSHLAANQTILWYMNSLKGYVPLLLLTFMQWSVLVLSPPTTSRDKRLRLFAFGLGFFLSAYAHTFAALFSVLVLLSLFIYLLLHQDEGSTPGNLFYYRCFQVGVILSPFLLLAFLNHGRYLVHIRDLFAVDSFRWVRGVFFPFGIGNKLVGWVGLAFVLTLLLSGIRSTHLKQLNFLSLFFVISVIFFVFIIWVLGVRCLYPRYLIGFVLPLLVLLSERVEGMKNPKLVLPLRGALILLFVVLPFQQGKWVFNQHSRRSWGLENFLKRVRIQTNDYKNICYSFSGVPYESTWSKHLYLYPASMAQGPDCENEFHIHFEKGRWGKKVYPFSDVRLSPNEFMEIFRDQEGRRLLLKRKSPPVEFLMGWYKSEP